MADEQQKQKQTKKTDEERIDPNDPRTAAMLRIAKNRDDQEARDQAARSDDMRMLQRPLFGDDGEPAATEQETGTGAEDINAETEQTPEQALDQSPESETDTEAEAEMAPSAEQAPQSQGPQETELEQAAPQPQPQPQPQQPYETPQPQAAPEAPAPDYLKQAFEAVQNYDPDGFKTAFSQALNQQAGNAVQLAVYQIQQQRATELFHEKFSDLEQDPYTLYLARVRYAELQQTERLPPIDAAMKAGAEIQQWLNTQVQKRGAPAKPETPAAPKTAEAQKNTAASTTATAAAAAAAASAPTASSETDKQAVQNDANAKVMAERLARKRDSVVQLPVANATQETPEEKEMTAQEVIAQMKQRRGQAVY